MVYALSNMKDKMLKFVKLGQQNPAKRKVIERKEDFNEIYSEFINEKAKEQSSRCSQCGVPFCQVHCPLSNNIPDWLKLTAEGRLKEAYELAQSTNNMPEVCGRICPQDRLCEGNCVIEQSGHGTVTIGSVEKFITENAWENKWVEPIKVRIEKKQSVGIIGAGPAGLACAEQLRKEGYQLFFDYNISDPQTDGFVICGPSGLSGGVMVNVLQMIGYDIPYNDGFLRPIHFLSDEGKIVKASKPAPIGAGHMNATLKIQEVSMASINKMFAASKSPWKERSMGVWGDQWGLHLCHGLNREGNFEIYINMDGGGCGGAAYSTRDGIPVAGCPQQCGMDLPDVEFNEMNFPLFFQYKKLKKNSVDLFESENHFGGHSHTINISYQQKKQIAVDIGSVSYTHLTLPTSDLV